MARIVCSLSGEGRGHATRIAALVEHLRREHDIVLLASHVAYDLLAPICRGMGRVTLR
ncbi:MAG: glycosyltransferase family protein, partial [Pirellulaceae bacterium]